MFLQTNCMDAELLECIMFHDKFLQTFNQTTLFCKDKQVRWMDKLNRCNQSRKRFKFLQMSSCMQSQKDRLAVEIVCIFCSNAFFASLLHVGLLSEDSLVPANASQTQGRSPWYHWIFSSQCFFWCLMHACKAQRHNVLAQLLCGILIAYHDFAWVQHGQSAFTCHYDKNVACSVTCRLQ